MVNEGYSFSQEDPIRLGIPVTRHFDNGKQDQKSRLNVPTNPDRSRTYLILRAHRMGQTSGWHRPWLPRGRRTSTNSHLPITTGTTFESSNPAGVSQLSPSQALMVNEGYYFSRKDPISLGIPITRHFDNGKTRPAKPADVPTIPIGAAHISFSGQHQISQDTSKTSPQVSPRWPRRMPGSDQQLEKHWPSGVKIKMTLESEEPKGR